MPSSPKIPKDVIVSTALDILIDEGYRAINIKRIARELGCSTQPISWQFGGMDGLRSALFRAAMDHVDRKIRPSANNVVAAFENIGEAYVDIAIDEPHLFRFICMGESGMQTEGGLASLLSFKGNKALHRRLCNELCITPAQAESFMSTMVIYTHGIAALIAAGVVSEERRIVHAMVKDTGIRFLVSLGISEEQAKGYFKQ